MQSNHLVPVIQSITNYKLWVIKKAQDHYCGLESLQLTASRREKDEQVNQEAEKVKGKDKSRHREGTFAENSLVCKKEHGVRKEAQSCLNE